MDKTAAILPGALDQFRLKEQGDPTDKGDIGQAAFFKLMVTQLQNQDPMKPMESGDFLGQIAQFSTVSGIGDLQSSFSSLASSMQSNQALQASTMVGRSVVIPSDTFNLAADQAATLSAELPLAATNVRVTVMDAAGQVIDQIPLGQQAAGRVQINWAGPATGPAAPAGAYSVRFDAVIDGREQAVQPQVTARVDSVTLSRDGFSPTLNLAGFGSVAMGDILEIL